jgi:superfamily II DNA or RNA helicase
MKMKTAIVCHTTDLMGQWKKEIKKFMPKARIGLVQRDKCIVKNKDIILISLKTLAKREYPPETFEDVGMTVWDEIHLMVTQLFSKAFPKLTTPYSLGLSATPHRNDKCEVIFNNFIGPIAHYEKRPPNSNVRVDCLVYKHRHLELEKNWQGRVQYTKTVTQACYSQERIDFIAKIIGKLVSTEGRNILILSEYINHLKELKKAAEKEVGNPEITMGLYIGEMTNDQRLESRKCRVIFGTYKIASVGMDIPSLNTLIMASPRKEIEQSVGRIFRKKGKLKPRIVDIIDDHNIFIAQGRVRKTFYKKYNYTIVQTKVDHLGNVTSQRVLHDVSPKKKMKRFSSTPPDIRSLLNESSEASSMEEDDESSSSQTTLL